MLKKICDDLRKINIFIFTKNIYYRKNDFNNDKIGFIRNSLKSYCNLFEKGPDGLIVFLL
jgi:hypothetical protein